MNLCLSTIFFYYDFTMSGNVKQYQSTPEITALKNACFAFESPSVFLYCTICNLWNYLISSARNFMLFWKATLSWAVEYVEFKFLCTYTLAVHISVDTNICKLLENKCPTKYNDFTVLFNFCVGVCLPVQFVLRDCVQCSWFSYPNFMYVFKLLIPRQG